MKPVTRLLSIAALATAASLLSACQTASVTARVEVAPKFTAIATLKQANPDVLGGLFGRESISTLALAGALGANQAAFAAVQVRETSGL